MLNFKKIEIEDIEIYKKFMQENCEFSCENAFINLLIWQPIYQNMLAISDNQLFIKSSDEYKHSFRLPIGGDLKVGIEKIFEFCGNQKPVFWVQEGERLDSLKNVLNQGYVFEEYRDAFDYIYLRNDLATLSGKKYHSKRNHINAFSKKFDWHYETITKENVDAIRDCALEWYADKADQIDEYMLCEKNGIQLILDNMERLSAKGGAIFVGKKAVAFTLGSEISSQVFDIHIEKALNEYSEAYTVINREFAARELGNYKYINREDDMGLEGLRKAKLSYKPVKLLKKYTFKPEEKL